ncbi:MAG: hypothetical protein JWO43_166 [Candidatus Adlerbacteria bacterium]|nr:hypothetical protein [Candidatus Adlerbacteria bacterium]
MQDRKDLKQAEQAHLAEAYAKNPELFEQRTYVDDAETLAEFGIHVPGKTDFVPAVLKLWPEDFIVEEVATDGAVYTIAPGNTPPKIGEGTTVFATLVKCGLSTFEAVDDIARHLGIPKDHISYAGIKDKDALTSQRISIRGAQIEAVAACGSPYYFLKDIEVGKGVIEKGRLKGNRFTVLVRTAKPLSDPTHNAAVSEALARVSRDGFYNFFYLQRFGTPRLTNFRWARDIIRGNFEKAAHDILSHTSERELSYFKNLRTQMHEKFGDWEAVHNIIAPYPIIFVHEHKLVDHLRQHPGDYLGALKTIPEQITLWVYALASLFFNAKISEHLIRSQEPPKELPFFLSPDKVDQELYREMLENQGLYPLSLQHVRQFPNIQVKKRMTPTKDHARIVNGELLPEGLLLEFELGKGQYATTFLSHLFNLTSGLPAQDCAKNRIDTKKILNEVPVAEVLPYFESVIQPKGVNMFEVIGGKEE